MIKVTKLMPVDDLGRVVIPIDIRRSLGIIDKDKLEVYAEGKSIIFKKPTTNCCICNSKNNLKEFEGQLFCNNCIKKMTQVFSK